ncbi:DUF6636 domain-containing protein [Rhodococcus sp. EPR-134]|uniref:DUF6636 domain-containing protein n=1 Tax=Rhodococcus sp. EPR-134 TaxID=1813675 RepID=UPI0007BBEE23|nr:DUF6636 domain-containing protein [Rhodococcus sp. EPR-134]KZF13225.1 hypothetical protein A2J01_14440 [Rhodococcus sp. EPR-134]
MVRVRVGFVLLGVGSALVLAGCSGEADSAPTVAAQPSSSTTTAVPTTTTTVAPVVPTTTAPPTTTLPLTDVQFERNESYYFTTPDGNFQCGIIKLPTRIEAGCEGTTTPVPPRPESCMVNWGNGIRVTDEGEGAFMCSGGEVYTSGGPDADPVLAAGQPLSKLGFTCTTTATDVSCVNDQTTHGFTVAADSNEVF